MIHNDISSLAEQIVARATAVGARVAVAESLTGGLVAAALIAVPGASVVVAGGIVAYDTGLKAKLLDVDRQLLRDHGPVDGDVARQMALGARHACTAEFHDRGRPAVDFGVSTTGVAGPDPDPQTGQAAGTVWIGVSSHAGDRAELLDFSGLSRDEVRATTVRAALELLLRELEAETGK